jgi:hypothetical protein
MADLFRWSEAFHAFYATASAAKRRAELVPGTHCVSIKVLLPNGAP